MCCVLPVIPECFNLESRDVDLRRKPGYPAFAGMTEFNKAIPVCKHGDTEYSFSPGGEARMRGLR